MQAINSLAVNILRRVDIDTLDIRLPDGNQGKHPKQYAFIHSSAHMAAIVGGIGSGKSQGGAIRAVRAAFGVAGSNHIQTPNLGVVTAPTYKMLQDASLRTFKETAGDLLVGFNKSDMIAKMKNGSEVLFRTADDPEKLKGPNISWWWGDEAALSHQDTWPFMIGRVRQHGQQGYVWITTTPKGRNWVFQKFVLDEVPDREIWKVKTRDNTFLNDGFIASLEADYTGAFAKQELEGEFVSFEGLVYSNFNRDLNETTEAEFKPGVGIWWAYDDGYSEGRGPGTLGYHPRVVLLCQVNHLGGLDVFAEYYATLEADYNITLDNILGDENKGIKGYGYPAPEVAYGDSSAAMFKGAIMNRGILAGGATHEVVEGIRNLRRMVRDGNGMVLLRIHPRCTELIRELETYRYDDTGQINGDRKPLKVDDHGPDCLRYVAWQLRRQ